MLWKIIFLIITAVHSKNYESFSPYYIEVCFSGNSSPIQKSSLKKVIAQTAGKAFHGVSFIHGACLDPLEKRYQKIKVCEKHEVDLEDEDQGIGFSTNSNLINNVVEFIEGRNFFLYGGLKNQKEYNKKSRGEMVQNYLNRNYLARNVHKESSLPTKKVDGREVRMDPQDTLTKEILAKRGLGWTWGVALSRPVYCARVPVSKDELNKSVNYLNNLNRTAFEKMIPRKFSIARNNCSHPEVNMLAETKFFNKIATSDEGKGQISVPSAIPLDALYVANNGPLDFRSIKSDEDLEIFRVRTRAGVILTHFPVYRPNQLFRPSETFGHMPGFHKQTFGKTLGRKVTMKTKRPYQDLLKLPENKDLKSNLKEQHLRYLKALESHRKIDKKVFDSISLKRYEQFDSILTDKIENIKTSL